jgi:hypothetical protein
MKAKRSSIDTPRLTAIVGQKGVLTGKSYKSKDTTMPLTVRFIPKAPDTINIGRPKEESTATIFSNLDVRHNKKWFTAHSL